MEGQISIFDFIKNDIKPEPMDKYSFCKDKDINDILFKLQNLCAVQRFALDKPSFEVWEHVSNLGYRLSLWVYFDDNTLPTSTFTDMLQKVIDLAKERSIELSVCQTPYFGNRAGCKYAYMFSTRFLDGRKNIKKDLNYEQL